MNGTILLSMVQKVSPISLPNLSSSTLFFKISFCLQYKNEIHIIAPDYITVQKRNTYYSTRLNNKNSAHFDSKSKTPYVLETSILLPPSGLLSASANSKNFYQDFSSRFLSNGSTKF